MILEATAPTRIDLAGGSLDIWPLNLLVDGAVTVNVAIDLYARCRLRARKGKGVRIESRDGRRSASFSSLAHFPARPGLELIQELVRQFAPRRGFLLETDCSAPAGSGLGGSSALAVALAGLLGRFTGRRTTRPQLIVLCRDLEARVIRTSTGTQDYIAALHGGWNAVWYGPGGPRIEKLKAGGNLERRMMLYFTGRSRASAGSNRDILGRCLEGDQRTLAALDGVAAAARDMRAALLSGDGPGIDRNLRQEWKWRQKLSPKVGQGGVEASIRNALRAGAAAGKPCGAGGGGCVLLLCDPDRQDRVRRALGGGGGRFLRFRVVKRGLRVKNLDGQAGSPV